MAECQHNPLKPLRRQMEGVDSDDTEMNTSQDDIIVNKPEDTDPDTEEQGENGQTNESEQTEDDRSKIDQESNGNGDDNNQSVQELRMDKNADSNQGENMQAEMKQKKYEHFESSKLEDGRNGKTGQGENDQMGKEQIQRNHGRAELEREKSGTVHVVEAAEEEEGYIACETPYEPYNLQSTPDQSTHVQVDFYLLILGKIYVNHVYIHLGPNEFRQLEAVDGYPKLWKCSVMFLGDPIKDSFRYRYGVYRLQNAVNVPVFGRVEYGKDLSYCVEIGEKCVSSKVQFDVFRFPEDKHYVSETTHKAVFYYLKWLLPLVCPESISETLVNVKGLSFYLLTKKNVKTVINWIMEQVLGNSATNIQRLYLCVVLGHLQRFCSPLPFPKDNKMVQTCDRFLQCLIACVNSNFLSASDLNLLEKLAVVLVENSSSPGWLTLAAYFYPYFGIDYILGKEYAKSLNYGYNDKEYHEMATELLLNIKIKNRNDQIAHKKLLHLVLKNAPTLDDALKLFTSPEVSQFFANEDEGDLFFSKFYQDKSQDRTQKKSAGTKLVEFHKMPKNIREKMQNYLFPILLEYSKSNEGLKDEHVNMFCKSIVLEKDLGMVEVLKILMELSKSKSVPRQDLLLDILDNKDFEKDWNQASHVDKVNICKSWVMTRLRNKGCKGWPSYEGWPSGVDKIVAVYEVINAIMRCSLNTSNKVLAEDVSIYVVDVFLGNEGISVLKAFPSIEKCVTVVQDCYKSHVRKILKQTPKVVKKSSNILKDCSRS
ncbi:Hypothetical predicted protein, partial [Paramuricea clavata]